MKSDTLRITATTVVIVSAIGLLSAAGVRACAIADRQEAAEKEQCKQMCTSGINSCKETMNYKSLVVDCAVDGGHVLRVTEVVIVR